jgi:hypothetical protein
MARYRLTLSLRLLFSKGLPVWIASN